MKFAREILGAMQADQKRMGEILEKETRIGTGEIEDLFLEQRMKDALYAKEKGIIQDIGDVQIPKGGKQIQISAAGN